MTEETPIRGSRLHKVRKVEDITTQESVVAVVDALGAKGIWDGKSDPRAVIQSLATARDTAIRSAMVQRLWQTEEVRAVGFSDTIIATTAIQDDAPDAAVEADTKRARPRLTRTRVERQKQISTPDGLKSSSVTTRKMTAERTRRGGRAPTGTLLKTRDGRWQAQVTLGDGSSATSGWRKPCAKGSAYRSPSSPFPSLNRTRQTHALF